MEEAFNILLIAVAVVIAIVKQLKKEAGKSSGKTFIPMSEDNEPDMIEDLPSSEPLGDTYGGYIPAGPHTAETSAGPYSTHHPSPSRSPKRRRTASPVTKEEAPSFPPATDPDNLSGSPDYGIRSIEEARRAIIWSEILRRVDV